MTMPSRAASACNRIAIRFDSMNDEEQRVAERRAAREIGRPVAGIHIADRHHVAGPGKGEELPEPDAAFRDRDRRVRLRQARPIADAHEAPPGVVRRVYRLCDCSFLGHAHAAGWRREPLDSRAYGTVFMQLQLIRIFKMSQGGGSPPGWRAVFFAASIRRSDWSAVSVRRDKALDLGLRAGIALLVGDRVGVAPVGIEEHR